MLNAALIGSIAASNAVDARPVPLPEDEPLPTPLTTTSGTTSNFDGLLGSGGTAQPGGRINLASGSYGNRTIAVSGTQANPIQVRATTLHGAVFTRLLITGNHVIVSGVDCDRALQSRMVLAYKLMAQTVGSRARSCTTAAIWL